MKVYTTIDAWNKMSYWAKLGGKKHREFTCFGRAVLEDGDFRVTDVYLVKQEGTAGGVDGDNEDINRLMFELFEKGIEPDEAFRCWIHSHPGTGPSATYLSGTDEANIERYLTGDFLISIVLDSKGDNPYCRIDLKNPRLSIEARVEVELPNLTAEEKEACEEEFKEKSSGRVFQYTGKGRGHVTGIGGYVGGYGGMYDDWDPYESHRTGGSGGKGKESGAGSRSGTSSGAEENDDVVGRPSYDSVIDGMLLQGVGEDEWDAWADAVARGEEADYAPEVIEQANTGQIEIDIVAEEDVPEWLVSLADEMACQVSDLADFINVKEYDEWIDDIVLKVQCGLKSLSDAVADLVATGISEKVATDTIMTRANA